MLVEHAEMIVREGLEAEFAAVLAEKAVPLLADQPGAGVVRYGRCVENPLKFKLLVEWESMDAHMAFTRSPGFGDFRAMLSQYTTGGGMEHYEMA